MFSETQLVAESSPTAGKENSRSSEGNHNIIFHWFLNLNLICIHIIMCNENKSCFTRSVKSISDRVRLEGRRLKKIKKIILRTLERLY